MLWIAGLAVGVVVIVRLIKYFITLSESLTHHPDCGEGEADE